MSNSNDSNFFACVNLNAPIGTFHFTYDGSSKNSSLEDVVSGISTFLKGKEWSATQIATMVVVGRHENGKFYVLNSVPVCDVGEIAKLYPKDKLKTRRASNCHLKEIFVYNAAVPPEEGLILRARTSDISTKRGYCKLFPIKLDVNVHELYALMDALMSVNMFKVKGYSDIALLRKTYRNKLGG